MQPQEVKSKQANSVINVEQAAIKSQREIPKRTQPPKCANASLQAPKNVPASTEINELAKLDQLITDFSTADLRVRQIPRDRIASNSLTPADTEVIDDAKNKYQKLISKASQLFQNAYISNPPLHNAKEMWGKFMSKLDATKIQLEDLVFLRRLGNESLDPNDRILLHNLVVDTKEITSKEQEYYIKEIVRRVVYHWKSLALAYNGWNNEAKKDSSAFLACVDLIHGDTFKEALFRELKDRILDVLTIIKREESELILSPEFSIEDLNKEINQITSDFKKYPIGSQQKIDSYRRMHDLFAFMLIKKISLEKYNLGIMQTGIPDINKQMAADFSKLYEVAQSPEKTDDNLWLDNFKSYLNDVQSAYLNSKQNFKEHIALGRMLNYLYQIAPKFLSKKEMSNLLSQLNHLPQLSNIKIKTVSDLGKLKGPIAISPNELPQEVADILKITGYYNLVVQNIREIILTPEIEEGSLSPVEERGEAAGYIGMVLIDINNKEGKIISVYRFADILAHEAAHIEWIKKIPNPLLLQLTPDERNSCSVDIKFSQKYLKAFLPKDKEECEEIFLNIAADKASVQAANLAMGFPKNLMDQTFALSSDSFLKSHDLSSIEELDLKNYPTNLALAFAKERFSEILDSLILGNDKDKIKNLLGFILNGDSRIECSFKITGNNSFDKAKELKFILINKDETKRDLTAEETELLNAFFNKSRLFFYPSENSRNFSLTALNYMSYYAKVNSRFFSKQTATKEITKTALTKALKYDVLELLKDKKIDLQLINELTQLYPKMINMLYEKALFFTVPSSSDHDKIFSLTVEMINDKNNVSKVQNVLKEINSNDPLSTIAKISLILYYAVKSVKDKNTASALAWILMVGIDKATKEEIETSVRFGFTSLELHQVLSSVLTLKEARELEKDYAKNLPTSR